MAKEVTGTLKLQIPAGQANPSPPVGPALGQAGLNIMEFCKDFNAKTQAQAGDVLPVVITIYNDKSFSFVCKQPPASALLKKAAKIASGSGEPHKTKVATITKDQLLEIVKIKKYVPWFESKGLYFDGDHCCFSDFVRSCSHCDS